MKRICDNTIILWVGLGKRGCGAACAGLVFFRLSPEMSRLGEAKNHVNLTYFAGLRAKSTEHLKNLDTTH